MSEPIRYLSPNLVQLIRMEIRQRAAQDRDLDDPNNSWGIERLCEKAFAEGYEQAYMRGYQSGYDSANERAKEENKAATPPKDPTGPAVSE